MKLFNRFFILIASALMLSTYGCSCSGADNEAPATDIKKVSPEIRDAAIATADSVIALVDNETALNEKLLDVRASIYSLSTSRGEKAAKDFEFVFRHHITDKCDSLARILF